MIHLFINGLAASAGGGLTYFRNVIPHLGVAPDAQATILLNTELTQELPAFPNIEYATADVAGLRRYWFEQSEIPRLIRRSGASVLLSTGNFALRKSPVPQILLSRNSIYTSSDYYRDLIARGEYRMWLETRVRAELAKRSVPWADITVAPSQAFADELKRWTGREVVAIHHGFDEDEFFRSAQGLPTEVQSKISAVEGSLKLLFVSHYNYYRNFETLIRALPILRERLAGRRLQLLLTCKLQSGSNPGAYNPASVAKLIRELGVSDLVVELGAIPYRSLHQLYNKADIYISPAYTETFAHPLVEAMASGLPVIASDIPVHREVSGEAAIYFPPFEPEKLAACVEQVVISKERSAGMAHQGRERAKQFSWAMHVKKILDLARGLTGHRT